ncbi:MAG: hypothetical protein OEM39_09665 [Acidimicrobiia bacterium]|nr:hypothetical protein [Acidimicrobiia bacterium]MDH3462887.1 hypothetical protein [Acidimicrobiia bacterium]
MRYLLWIGFPLALVALLVPAPDDGTLLSYSLVHLLILQLAALLLVDRLAPSLGRTWFRENSRPWLASAASLVAIVTGFAALLTLGTAAASRFDPSLQFLQLLSSLDIAWATAALYLGARALWNRNIACVLGLGLVIACLGSIAAYLDTVGFRGSGGWLVDGNQLMRLVIPADMAAAAIALTTLLVAARRQGAPTEQRNPQS